MTTWVLWVLMVGAAAINVWGIALNRIRRRRLQQSQAQCDAVLSEQRALLQVLEADQRSRHWGRSDRLAVPRGGSGIRP